MLTLLSLFAGGGLVGGIVLLVVKPALRSVLAGLLGQIPPRVIWALVAMGMILGAVLWYNHAIGRAFANGREAGVTEANAKWKAAFDQQRRASLQWKRNYQEQSALLTSQIGERYAQDLRRNDALADDLRLRGPGRAAACSGSVHSPRVASGTGGHDETPSGPNAPGDQVPADDRNAIVPWGWLVRKAEDHDDLLAEVNAWRSHDAKQKALHQEYLRRLRDRLPEPEFGRLPESGD